MEGISRMAGTGLLYPSSRCRIVPAITCGAGAGGRRAGGVGYAESQRGVKLPPHSSKRSKGNNPQAAQHPPG